MQSIAELEKIYGPPVPTSIVKEVDHLMPLTAEYIRAAPFVVVATSGPAGLDCSPRGDPAGFVHIADDHTLLLPDRRGNNRLDTLRNLVEDPRIALLFLVPGIGVTLRVNGSAALCTDLSLRTRFAIDDKLPATVIVVTIKSVYTQCPKALIRSHLWDPELHRAPDELPSVGQIMQAISDGSFDGQAYDESYPDRIRQTMY